MARLKGAEQSEAMRAKVDALGLVSTWYTTCRRCKAKLRGSLDALRRHACGETSQANAEPA